MKPDFNLCDCCGKRVDGKPLFIATDRKMDAAGSMDSEGKTVDLCRDCAVEVIDLLCSRNVGSGGQVIVPDYESGVKAVEAIRKVASYKSRRSV